VISRNIVPIVPVTLERRGRTREIASHSTKVGIAMDISKTSDPKEYLGDGVYAINDGSGIWLHANDLDNPTDSIFINPQVLESLVRFARFNGYKITI